jgi:polyhydroxyalkanoate synthesis regulator phasin
MFPVPTHKEMDELYKEIYLLKKRIKELEKKNPV